MEFTAYDDEFYRFLASNNVEMVFLSLDQAKAADAWKNDIQKFNLNGYHAMAGKILFGSLKEEIFGGGNVFIPRYFLVRTDGTIPVKEMGRPSSPKFRTDLVQCLKVGEGR